MGLPVLNNCFLHRGLVPNLVTTSKWILICRIKVGKLIKDSFRVSTARDQQVLTPPEPVLRQSLLGGPGMTAESGSVPSLNSLNSSMTSIHVLSARQEQFHRPISWFYAVYDATYMSYSTPWRLLWAIYATLLYGSMQQLTLWNGPTDISHKQVVRLRRFSPNLSESRCSRHVRRAVTRKTRAKFGTS